jgi:thiamine biosynthesis lipoprotein
VRFAIDGLAKGYIIDRALDAARALPGVKGLMVDIGGDLRCWGQAPSGDGWRVGVVDAANCGDNAAPVAIIDLTDKAAATSGRSNRIQTIFDPRTGLEADKIVMATAVANNAADADALASAFSVMAPSDSLALAEKLPGVAAHIATSDGRIFQTSNWAGMVVAQANTAPRSAVDAKAGTAWPTGFSLKIDYEVPNITSGRRPHPPYVTIWVTNAQGNLVRTLAFYANKARYMPENYVFWNRFGAGQADKIYSVTRPTRPPGRYTLDWDGLDDHGQPVPQGKYTINIEAAREHAGHSIQRIDLVLGSANVSGGAAAQDELGASQARYGNSP